MKKRKLQRLIYRFLFWFGQQGHHSDILYGYYRKFKAPKDVADDELDYEINRLGKAIQEAS